MVATLGLVDYNWVHSPEGSPYINAILDKQGKGVMKCGYLDKPIFNKKLKEFPYKVILSGKSGCGKTSTINKLAGYEVSKQYRETAGIEQTTIYWPVRLFGSKEPVVFKLKFCDSGEGCLSRFSHMLPAMQENADGVIFFFSMTDRASFEDLPQQMSRMLVDESQSLSKLVIATKLDQHGKAEVPQRELIEFEKQYNIPIIGVSNITTTSSMMDSASSDLRTSAPILNCLCERLYYRDQQEAGLVV